MEIIKFRSNLVKIKTRISMKKILGLDLGSSSIGWAVVSENTDNSLSTIALGSRIIPMSPDDVKEFTQGLAISKNAKRTKARTQRKGYDRYQLRRKYLSDFFSKYEMQPNNELIELPKLELWKLRSNAISQQLSLKEIGRVLYLLNQKRGYKSVKEDSADKQQREYVQGVMGRHKHINEQGLTIGQFFYRELSQDKDYRTKEQVFPRAAYQEEFDKIIECQKSFYPEIFTEQNINILRNEIIYFQRNLKSCKHLVSICEFEKRAYLSKKSGELVFDGPKVAPKSSPLAQICKIWESVNNINLRNKRNEKFEITPSQRRNLFNHLDNNEKLTLTDLYKILGIKKSDGWWAGKAIGRGLQGNTTKMAIKNALGDDYEQVMKFNVKVKDTNNFDVETGEVIQIASGSFQNEPLYKLWHLIYSVKDNKELSVALEKQFGITESSVIDALSKIDFVKQGYANKSAKAMRRILPYLELGLMYSDACLAAGFRHSESLTVEENAERELKDKLKQIPKNELRQPIVEKILNQMINVVNALMEKYGTFDEIRVELARELKQSSEERNETHRSIGKVEKLNKNIANRISQEYNLAPTRSRIHKYKMYEESDGKCFYCDKPLSMADFLNGYNVEVEHIIPKSLYFDDSLSNKVCSCRDCNSEKGGKTAYDYMSNKSDLEFAAYLERVDTYFREHKISKTKRDRLLTKGSEIPTDFIDRQLRESQFIARKSREILTQVCRDVTATSGSVTDKLRSLWGWDKVLHSLNFERYKLAGLTEVKHREHKSKSWEEEVIKDWSKRLDHRHHAIDALVIACTKQGYIQRINNMSELKDVAFKGDEHQGERYQGRLTQLEKYLVSQPHPSVLEVQRFVDSILVSFKAGKKLFVPGKRYVHKGGKRVEMQRGVVVPRGALHEESIYGLITTPVEGKNGRKSPQQQVVLKYPLTSIVRKDLEFVIDGKIREILQQRFDNHTGAEKEVWKDLSGNPVLFNGSSIKSVRLRVGSLTSAFAQTSRGYVKKGNNHHVAIYVDARGKRVEHCVTFWSAIERRQRNVPVIIEKPSAVWDALPEGTPEEFLATLPDPTWRFEVSLQQNEMFILGLESEAFEEAMRTNDYKLLNKYLYRVQSLSSANYWFRLHIETINDKTPEGKIARKFHLCKSVGGFYERYPQKVYVNLLGEIKKL